MGLAGLKKNFFFSLGVGVTFDSFLIDIACIIQFSIFFVYLDVV